MHRRRRPGCCAAPSWSPQNIRRPPWYSLILSTFNAARSASTHADAAAASIAEAAPPPVDFNRVYRAHPERYLRIDLALGNAAAVASAARDISNALPKKGAGDLEKLRAVLRWKRAHLHAPPSTIDSWGHRRPFEQIVADGFASGCADDALVFGTLARALGVPAVWVKTMDADWIRRFVRGTATDWVGHVFVEVFASGRWRLVDAAQGEIYDEYDPRQRLLPGGRWAYDKGGDAATLVLSLDGEAWREQTRQAFQGFDLAQLPVGDGRPIERSFVAVGSKAFGESVAERCRLSGVPYRIGFNYRFEEYLPRARGQWLILAATATQFLLPAGYRDAWSPVTSERLSTLLAAGASRRAPSRQVARG